MKKQNNLWKKAAALILVFALALTGCGTNEDKNTVTQFTSEDNSVSIEVTGQWQQENCIDLFADGDESLGWFAAGWIALSNANNDLVVVAQLPEALSLFSDQDALLSSMFMENTLSDSKPMDNPTIPNMEVLQTTLYEAADTSGNNGEVLVLYGETAYAQYMILYSAKKIKDADVTFFHNLCASFKETPPETETDASVNSSDTIQWFNNTYAVLTVLNNLDYTLYGGTPANDGGKILAETVLENTWGITDRASADETLQGLTDTTSAWDYSRAMWLLSYYYLAGYYTKNEALDQSLALAKTIQSAFDSWDSFMESYFAGYEYWSEESSDERRQIYEDLKASDDNPFALDWNTPLEKTW